MLRFQAYLKAAAYLTLKGPPESGQLFWNFQSLLCPLRWRNYSSFNIRRHQQIKIIQEFRVIVSLMAGSTRYTPFKYNINHKETKIIK